MGVMYGSELVFGSAEPLPLEGFPEGRIKVKIRGEDWVRVYVATSDGIREFVVEEKDGKWVPGLETGRNMR